MKNEISQGSVLASIMFLIYVNDMIGVSSYIILFADDAKLRRKIRSHKDCEGLRNDNIYGWSKTWEMEFNAKKCNVLEMGKSAMRLTWTRKLGQNIISIEK